jgi:hypothetical protein
MPRREDTDVKRRRAGQRPIGSGPGGLLAPGAQDLAAHGLPAPLPVASRQ